jgi:hypothetical protein
MSFPIFLDCHEVHPVKTQFSLIFSALIEYNPRKIYCYGSPTHSDELDHPTYHGQLNHPWCAKPGESYPTHSPISYHVSPVHLVTRADQQACT